VTTRWLKEHLEDAIARHEQIAAEVGAASEPETTSQRQDTEPVRF